MTKKGDKPAAPPHDPKDGLGPAGQPWDRDPADGPNPDKPAD